MVLCDHGAVVERRGNPPERAARRITIRIAAPRRSPTVPTIPGASARLQHRAQPNLPLGRHTEAVDRLERAKRENITPVMVAKLHTAFGERDSAFAWLERAVRERDPEVIELAHEPLLDALRPDPRFPALARRIGLP